MILDGFNNITGQRKIRLFHTPALMKQRNGLTCCIQNRLLRQQCLGGKMGKLVFEPASPGAFKEAPPRSTVISESGSRWSFSF